MWCIECLFVGFQLEFRRDAQTKYCQGCLVCVCSCIGRHQSNVVQVPFSHRTFSIGIDWEFTVGFGAYCGFQVTVSLSCCCVNAATCNLCEMSAILNVIFRGDYRSGKRLNIRKLIPYIASQFRKNKIWLRRTKRAKRDYQIMLAIDDSSSMKDNMSMDVSALSYVDLPTMSVLFCFSWRLSH